MSTLARQSPLISPRRQYISTGPFHEALKSYTVTTDGNGNQTGTFANLTDASATNCPKGRILHENGKSLVPDKFNPDLGINDYYVGVYDPRSGLKGYIKPNDTVFATLNTNKPGWINEYVNGDDTRDDTSLVGTSVAINGNITIPRSAADATGVAGTGGAGSTLAAGITQTTAVGKGTLIGGVCFILNPLVTTSSIILVTSTTATEAAVSVTDIAAGSFKVNGSGVETFNYLIIN